MAFVGILSQKELPFGSLVIQAYSACVVYTKTIIHLIVGEIGGYLPSRELLIINNMSPSFTINVVIRYSLQRSSSVVKKKAE